MDFKTWLMDKFLEWEKTQTNGRSNYSNFARYLGIKIQTLTQWRIGNNEPSMEFARILADKLGNEVYSILGYADPGGAPNFDSFPPAVKDALLRASETIRTSGIKGDSPEAWKIVEDAMSKLGFIQIDTPKPVEASKKQ